MKKVIALCMSAALVVFGAGCGGGGSNGVNISMSTSNAVPLSFASLAGSNGLYGSLSPANLKTHYNFPSQYTGVNQTIVIVDAPGSANVASDLNVFNGAYGLPLCNTTNACFQLIDLSNGAKVASNNDWAAEIALDTQWAHAMAPAAKIVLVQAKSSSLTDLLAALKVAVTQANVVAISMSWGATEFSSETSSIYDGFFKSYPNIAFFAAAGDSGNNGSNQIYPAASPYVTAVGGSSIRSLALPMTATSEVAWAEGGGGPSIYEAMPSYQSSFMLATNDTQVLSLNKNKRAIPDVAYNADPNASPVVVYIKGAWYYIGGTSEGAPQWAAIVANLGQYLHSKGSSVATLLGANGGFNGVLHQTKLEQANSNSFFDVSVGSNDTSNKPCILCSASAGFNDVTGLGVPNVGNLFGHF